MQTHMSLCDGGGAPLGQWDLQPCESPLSENRDSLLPVRLRPMRPTHPCPLAIVFATCAGSSKGEKSAAKRAAAAQDGKPPEKKKRVQKKKAGPEPGG